MRHCGQELGPSYRSYTVRSTLSSDDSFPMWLCRRDPLFLVFPKLYTLAPPWDPDDTCSQGKITYNWLGEAAAYSGKGSLILFTSSFFEGMPTVSKLSYDNLLHTGNAEHMVKMALLVADSDAQHLLIQNYNIFQKLLFTQSCRSLYSVIKSPAWHLLHDIRIFYYYYGYLC